MNASELARRIVDLAKTGGEPDPLCLEAESVVLLWLFSDAKIVVRVFGSASCRPLTGILWLRSVIADDVCTADPAELAAWVAVKLAELRKTGHVEYVKRKS